ncbi:hypothetical protein [Methylomicrobium sp. Wu6]|uniref:hypothetical protein n=1 Tax=Methylomicrobium sp. Wu6 TaxID=3107928 RepID=UPI002DD64F2D|nr:hypothetical protein [Methylomicrobium sp. Wu6]MEC4748230.1 hypothetical protein [Methylomicrobium sp. Wu6]
MIPIRFTSLSLALLLISAPAGALDLTGTWAGKFNCSSFGGATFPFVEKNQSLKISQTGNELSVRWLDVNNVIAANFTGFVINDNKKRDTNGQAAIANCTTGPDLTSTIAEIANLKVVINRSKAKGSLTGNSIYSSKGQAVGQCKWTFKLVNTDDPLIPSTCPQ